jgi:hypothetical protein
MKYLLTLSVILGALVQTLTADSQLEACKTFVKEGTAYHHTLKAGEVDETLNFYKENIIANCGNVVAKAHYKVDFFPQLMVKSTTSTLTGCKASIKIAKSYQANGGADKSVIDAHKENIVDNCGTLVAKSEPVFCPFGIEDSASVENLKQLCQSAIKEAHDAKAVDVDKKALAVHKANIVEKCGELHKSL